MTEYASPEEFAASMFDWRTWEYMQMYECVVKNFDIRRCRIGKIRMKGKT